MRSHIFRCSFLIFFIFISSLFAQGWFWQNPSPQGNDLRDVHVFNSNTAIAVGGSGTVLKTNDGGINWDSQPVGATYHLNSLYFIDDNTGWVVGFYGIILKTTDGGDNWNSQTSGTTETLWSVYFTDNNTGWSVGTVGTILNTINGGMSWNSQTSGTTSSLESVYFTDNYTGWSVGTAGTILKTTNGGTNWNSQTSGTTWGLYSVYFVNNNTGWAVGDNGTILKTTDGGVTFIGDEEIIKIPEDYLLSQNYPNPFNPTTNIQYAVSIRQFVTLKVYDVLGNEIATLVNEEKTAGSYAVEFNGDGLTSGVYFYRLQTGSFVETKKMVLIR